MSKKKLKKISELGFIPGIYNYCDRWCERCEHCAQCMSFAMGKKIEEKGGFNFDDEVTRDDENVWVRLKEVFESTYEVLHELAEERGIDIEDIYTSENIDKEFWGDDYESGENKDADDLLVESSDIIRVCLIYENLADRCLEKIFEALEERDDNEGDKVSEKGVDDALDIINWYLDLVQAKMRRALYGYYRVKKSGREDEDDYNGSAKVALIAIDRMMPAWKTIAAYCPGNVREISHLIVVLEQLEHDIERQFKEARCFLRPGFEK